MSAVESISPYLAVSSVINFDHPSIQILAAELRADQTSTTAIAQACFEWVRDQIRHSSDYQLNPVTCRASEVLEHRTGYCYAKSHLLVALLRACSIPAGFCYQRLSFDEASERYCLHGLVAVKLPDLVGIASIHEAIKRTLMLSFAHRKSSLPTQHSSWGKPTGP